MPEDDDQTTDLTLSMPGSDVVIPPSATATAGAAVDTAGDSPELAAMKLQMAQMSALLNSMHERLASGAAPAVPDVVKEPNLIGENWAHMTSAQAKAKGCRKVVLCSDGYYVPLNPEY